VIDRQHVVERRDRKKKYFFALPHDLRGPVDDCPFSMFANEAGDFSFVHEHRHFSLDCEQRMPSTAASVPDDPQVPLTPLRPLSLRARQVFLFDR
jgi:hypothetical protein